MEFKKARSSNLELLKVFAMLMIVLGHSRPRDTIAWTNTYFPYGCASDNIQFFLTSIGGYLGAYGNCIFIICSAWFLVGNSIVKREKVCKMFSDVWIFSVMSFAIVTILKVTPPISWKEYVMTFFPNIYGVYWFVTCYILFYILHPALNAVVYGLNKHKLLCLSLFLFILYFIMYFIFPKALFYFSELLGFCCIYIIVGYLKLYMSGVMDNKSLNIKCLSLSLLIMIILLITFNFLFLRIPPLSDKIGYFSYFNNALIFLTSLSIFNLFRMSHKEYYNRKINYLSSLTLLIFIIHENYFYRTYIRHIFYDDMISKYGVDNIFFYTLLQGFGTFVVSYLIAIVYDKTLNRPLNMVSYKFYSIVANRINKVIDKIEKIDT